MEANGAWQAPDLIRRDYKIISSPYHFDRHIQFFEHLASLPALTVFLKQSPRNLTQGLKAFRILALFFQRSDQRRIDPTAMVEKPMQCRNQFLMVSCSRKGANEFMVDLRPQSQWSQQSQGRNPFRICLLYTSPSPRDATLSRMPSSA